MQQKTTSSFVYKLARAGAISLGIVYVMIGVVAILSLLRIKEGGASEASTLNMLDDVPLGRVFVALIFLGLLSFICWKFYNAITDPYGYGKTFKGLLQRIAIAAAVPWHTPPLPTPPCRHSLACQPKQMASLMSNVYL